MIARVRQKYRERLKQLSPDFGSSTGDTAVTWWSVSLKQAAKIRSAPTWRTWDILSQEIGCTEPEMPVSLNTDSPFMPVFSPLPIPLPANRTSLKYRNRIFSALCSPCGLFLKKTEKQKRPELLWLPDTAVPGEGVQGESPEEADSYLESEIRGSLFFKKNV